MAVFYKVNYKANNGWAGIFWQSPAKNWGAMEGGYNLTGAKKLSFWSKGENGDKEVNIAFGGVAKSNDKKSYDTSKCELKALKLTNEWKQYSINLDKKDMTSIISGFVFTVPGKQQIFTLMILNTNSL
jgi:hypothetical protein